MRDGVDLLMTCVHPPHFRADASPSSRMPLKSAPGGYGASGTPRSRLRAAVPVADGKWSNLHALENRFSCPFPVLACARGAHAFDPCGPYTWTRVLAGAHAAGAHALRNGAGPRVGRGWPKIRARDPWIRTLRASNRRDSLFTLSTTPSPQPIIITTPNPVRTGGRGTARRRQRRGRQRRRRRRGGLCEWVPA